MIASQKHAGLALVELLIVAIVVAVLAVAVIPQFWNPSNDAFTCSGKFNLHTLRAQIELYKSQHGGAIPSQQLAELTSSTNRSGAIGKGPAFRYGPYIASIPANPITGSNTVAAAPPGGAVPTAVVPGAGWQYDAGTGEIWFNDNTYYPFSQQ